MKTKIARLAGGLTAEILYALAITGVGCLLSLLFAR